MRFRKYAMIRESCVLCACKHIAQARVLMLEYKRSPKEYDEHYFFAMGHLAEAEDELVRYHAALSTILRHHRKKLEADDQYAYPYTELILNVAKNGEDETEKRVRNIEKEFEGKSPADLMSWWNEIQK